MTLRRWQSECIGQALRHYRNQQHFFCQATPAAGKTRMAAELAKLLFAEGKIDAVIQATNKIWDIHPLIPIIKAAGGIVTTWKNENAVKAGDILVTTNKTIHKKLLRLLKPVSK